jgi:hypothetical protein
MVAAHLIELTGKSFGLDAEAVAEVVGRTDGPRQPGETIGVVQSSVDLPRKRGTFFSLETNSE